MFTDRGHPLLPFYDRRNLHFEYLNYTVRVYQIFLSFRNNFTLTSDIILLLSYIIFFLSLDIFVHVFSESSTPGVYRACEALLLTATFRLTLLLTTVLTKYFVHSLGRFAM
jgi:dolichyl-phosphate-mannose--protein O-mannosyl transferase